MFIDVEQNTEEWERLRAGKMTSSNLGVIMANFGKPFGEPAKKYAVNIATEQLTGKKISSGYSNDHMERGHIDEPIARTAYEEQYFCQVTNGGFYDLGDYGCSPDGHVGDNGLIEIKSALPSIHFERVRKRSCDSTNYKWQMLGNLLAAKKDYIDFVSYCADFHDDGKLFVIRYFANDFKEEFKQIETRLNEFRTLIADYKKVISESAYFINSGSFGKAEAA